MQTYNIPNIIPAGTVMNATLDSIGYKLLSVISYSIQIVFTGTPTGSFKLQASDDPATYQQQAVINFPTHWTDVKDSTFVVAAAGDVMWTVEFPGYTWVRVVYTDSSGGTSTAIITSAVINTKGS